MLAATIQGGGQLTETAVLHTLTTPRAFDIASNSAASRPLNPEKQFVCRLVIMVLLNYISLLKSSESGRLKVNRKLRIAACNQALREIWTDFGGSAW